MSSPARPKSGLHGWSTNRFWNTGHRPTGGPGAKFNHVEDDNVSQILTCYVCGRGYSYASIKPHLRVCPDKRARLLEGLPHNVRRPLPQAPSVPIPGGNASKEEVDAYNKVADAIYREGMPTCPNKGCGRKFAPERVMTHVNACSHPAPPKVKSPVRPDSRRMLACYCCGMMYSFASLPLHLDDCPAIRKNEYRVALPVNLRPRIPDPPKQPIPGASASMEEYDAYNAEAKAIFQANMPTCPNVGCGRQLEPDRLLQHLKGCKFPSPGFRDGPGQKRPLNVYTCFCCGRQYGPTSIEIHWGNCLKAHSNNMRILPPHLRPPQPRMPPMRMPGDGVSQDVVDAYNAQAQAVYEEYRPMCPKVGCGRQFAAPRLLVHLRQCKRPDPANLEEWRHPAFSSAGHTRPMSPPDVGQVSSMRELKTMYGDSGMWVYNREEEEERRKAAQTQKLQNGANMKEARLRLFGADSPPSKVWTSPKRRAGAGKRLPKGAWGPGFA